MGILQFSKQLKQYILIKEKIEKLSSVLILAMFLSLLISKKISYIEITKKYIEYLELSNKKIKTFK